MATPIIWTGLSSGAQGLGAAAAAVAQHGISKRRACRFTSWLAPQCGKNLLRRSESESHVLLRRREPYNGKKLQRFGYAVGRFYL